GLMLRPNPETDPRFPECSSPYATVNECRHTRQVCVWGADRQTDRETERERERERDRQTDRQTHRHRDTHTHRHTDTQTHRHTDIQRELWFKICYNSNPCVCVVSLHIHAATC